MEQQGNPVKLEHDVKAGQELAYEQRFPTI
jgi:hypothetical protein